MMRLHSLRAARASFDSFANPLVIDTAADANDHENDLQLQIAFVKNDSQLRLRQGVTMQMAQETGGRARRALAE